MERTLIINEKVTDFDSITVFCEEANDGADRCDVTLRNTRPVGKGIFLTTTEDGGSTRLFLSTATAIKFAEALIKLAHSVEDNNV